MPAGEPRARAERSRRGCATCAPSSACRSSSRPASTRPTARRRRRSARSACGASLEILAEVRETLGLPVTTDVHDAGRSRPWPRSSTCCRSRRSCAARPTCCARPARSGRTVNVKKGQFLAPGDMRYAVDKVRAGGGERVLLTERGTTFGYHDLVVDYRGLSTMRAVRAGDLRRDAQRPVAGRRGRLVGRAARARSPRSRARPSPAASTRCSSRRTRIPTRRPATARACCRSTSSRGCCAAAWRCTPPPRRSLGHDDNEQRTPDQMTSPHRVFIGYDPSQHISYEVLRYSLEKHATEPLDIQPIDAEKIPDWGRPIDPLASTPFTYTRFLVPWLTRLRGHRAVHGRRHARPRRHLRALPRCRWTTSRCACASTSTTRRRR